MVASLQRRKQYIAALVIGVSSSAMAQDAQQVEVAECIGSYFMSATMALPCDMPYIPEPPCVQQQAELGQTDFDLFFEREEAAAAWADQYAAMRGFSYPAGGADICDAAAREIADQTAIGQMLGGAQ